MIIDQPHCVHYVLGAHPKKIDVIEKIRNILKVSPIAQQRLGGGSYRILLSSLSDLE
jgi:hypothetical protein